MLVSHKARIAALFGALALGFAVTACDSSTEPEEQEPEVATIQLTVGTQTISVAENGTVTGGPILIAQGNTAISAAFLRADGTPDPIVTADVFRLEVSSDNAGIAGFSRGGAFNGNLVGAAAGTTLLRFSLFHIEEGHADFGPFPVSVTVQ